MENRNDQPVFHFHTLYKFTERKIEAGLAIFFSSRFVDYEKFQTLNKIKTREKGARSKKSLKNFKNL